MLTWVFTCLGAFGATALGVGLLRRLAFRENLLDVPNERSSHSMPTPKGGGAAIVVVTLGGLSALSLVFSFEFPLRYVIGALLISAVSLLDDLITLPSLPRLGVHTVAALLLVPASEGAMWVALPGVGQVEAGWLGVVLAIVWVVGLTNAYNFMDGIDGIAGGQALVAGLLWAWLGRLTGQPMVTALGFLCAASAAGFLVHNWPPAKIFMGDVGSAFLGYTFAALAVMGTQPDPRLAVCGLAAVWLYAFDTSFTFLRRLSRRENVFAAHRSHLYQRLVIAGRSHRFVTLLYSLLAALGSLFAVWWTLSPETGALPLVGFAAVSSTGLWAFVRREERCATRKAGPLESRARS